MNDYKIHDYIRNRGRKTHRAKQERTNIALTQRTHKPRTPENSSRPITIWPRILLIRDRAQPADPSQNWIRALPAEGKYSLCLSRSLACTQPL